MSLQYAEAKIKEAIALAKGNKARANQIVAAMAQQDVKLLQGLTKHHLNGIVAYHVERVVSGKVSKPKPQVANEVKKKPAVAKRAVPSNPFGKEILRAVAGGNGEVFGFDHGTAPLNKPASQTHINAIKQMAARAKSRL